MKPSLFSGGERDSSTLFEDLREALASPDRQDAGTLPVCGSGFLLRSLLAVHAVLGAAALYGARSLPAWVDALASADRVAVPALLGWLLLVCALRRWLAGFAPANQLLLVSLAGAFAVLTVWWPLQWLDPSSRAVRVAWAGLAPACTGALLAAAVYQAERWRHRARLPAATAARLADLQTRIRPHFLFNTLNTAIALVQTEPLSAEAVLEDLSDLFRAALGSLDEATTVGAEITLSQRYLAIEQLRFGDRLKVVWSLDPAADHAALPPLLLQPLIENAVRHGVEPSDRGGTIDIRSLRRRDRVLISVTNSVPLAPSRPGHGIGVASVRERLHLMHDLDAEFRSGLIEDGRWRASLSIPAG